MNFLFTILMISFISSSLSAYKKQIVFDSFTDKQSAEAAFEEFKGDELYERLKNAGVENDFTLQIIVADKKHLFVAAPIKQNFILDELVRLMQPKFQKLRVVNLEELPQTPKNEEIKSDENTSKENNESNASVTPQIKELLNTETVPTQLQEVGKNIPQKQEENKTEETQKEETQDSIEEENITAVIAQIQREFNATTAIVKQVNLKQEAIEEKEEEENSSGLLWFFILIISVMVGKYYFEKLKNIYDQY